MTADPEHETSHLARADAVRAYQVALADHLSWRGGVDARLAQLLLQAPSFVMAHVLRAYRLVCSRDPRQARPAQAIVARAAALQPDRIERLHLSAIAAAARGDFAHAKQHLDMLLALRPRDLLALSVANTFDHYDGDPRRMRDRVTAVLPAWSAGEADFHVVLALQAFALEECGELAGAECAARQALAIDPLDIRAQHVMAHVFEMTGRPEAGLRWFEEQAAHHQVDRHLTRHCQWHLALFHLVLGQTRQALALYDELVRGNTTRDVADLIDASALLWRLRLRGTETGPRAVALAAAWTPHVVDRFSSFNDLHAMLAFVAAGQWARAQWLEAELMSHRQAPTRYGSTTRAAGLQACRALMAFGRGQDALAITLLSEVATRSHCIGGSHAQRDVLYLTLQQALERLRHLGRAPSRIPHSAAA